MGKVVYFAVFEVRAYSFAFDPRLNARAKRVRFSTDTPDDNEANRYRAKRIACARAMRAGAQVFPQADGSDGISAKLIKVIRKGERITTCAVAPQWKFNTCANCGITIEGPLPETCPECGANPLDASLPGVLASN